MIDNFSEYEGAEYLPVFSQSNVPIFQNKVYPTYEQAKAAENGEVKLIQSPLSGFIFNKSFTPHLMNYDVHYQNEQANSNFFKTHLSSVLALLKSWGIENKKVIEVGCGKAVFFDMMVEEGIDCFGFDPTYEGNNSRIKKEYFDENQKGIEAGVIIMRHTLEHIPNPFSFLHTIANSNNNKGFLFVEVPTFDWIVNKNAFWDIFYEHCNYFTEQSLASMFTEAITGNFFGGQYIYLWADLSKIRSTIPNDLRFTKRETISFNAKLKEYQEKLKNAGTIAIWGAGAKGSTFLNLLDKECDLVKYVIDINPAKQNKFIAGTGHQIFSEEVLLKDPVDTIFIMNDNYKQEIIEQISKFNLKINLISI
jgi:2-polyprenyl-3-methyl-5-hydroxy-6-metoxy-1,4-benzoquinol methylase